MQDLNVTLVQADLIWENISANLSMLDKMLNSFSGETDLIILPEMFSTGFTMSAASQAEDMNGRAVQWIQEKSRQKSADIAGSVIIRENGCYFNRLLWAKPTGELYSYDKRHLFRMAGEDNIYTAGNKLLTVELNSWKIRPFICYDLRFPVWTRNLDNAYDLAVFVANWPEKRSAHWQKLLVARAIENQCFVVGVNRVGRDGNGFDFSGDSTAIDPLGVDLFTMRYLPGLHTFRLPSKTLLAYRKEFPAWMDADTSLISRGI